MITVKEITLDSSKQVQAVEIDFFVKYPLSCAFINGNIKVFFEQDTIVSGNVFSEKNKHTETFLILKTGEVYEQLEHLFWNYIDTVVNDKNEFIHVFMGVEIIPF